jgi:hypothetical protein
VYLFYDEVNAAGGHARFEGGRLVSRLFYDARGSAPVRRTLDKEEVLTGLDPSDWVWVPGADAVEAGATPLFGPGIRDNYTIAALVEAAAATPLEPPAKATPPKAAPPPPSTGIRSGLRGLLRKLRG